MLFVLAYPNLGQILGYQVKISNTTLLTSIMPEGGVRSCEVVYGSDKQHCNNDHDFDGYIRGFGLNSISATTIIEWCNKIYTLQSLFPSYIEDLSVISVE